MPSGFSKVPTLSGGQESFLNQLLSYLGPQFQQAQQGFQSFLPGGEGNNPIIAGANKNFQQQTLPQILNAFGSDVGFGDSSLNQALAGGAADLNTNIADIIARNQLTAAQGLGSMATQGAGLGLGTPSFAYLEKQPAFWKQLLLGLVGGAGKIGGAFFGG
jgi:hypothetical protein